ncbi:Ras-like protein member 12, partial [Branchiostoma belcheri]
PTHQQYEPPVIVLGNKTDMERYRLEVRKRVLVTPNVSLTASRDLTRSRSVTSPHFGQTARGVRFQPLCLDAFPNPVSTGQVASPTRQPPRLDPVCVTRRATQVSKAEGNSLASQYGCSFFEASAAGDYEGVQKVFHGRYAKSGGRESGHAAYPALHIRGQVRSTRNHGGALASSQRGGKSKNLSSQTDMI